jgi:hypothetical protein
MGLGFPFLVQKSQECQKRNILLRGSLKTAYQIYHSEEEKQQKKIPVFIATIFCFPEFSDEKFEGSGTKLYERYPPKL